MIDRAATYVGIRERLAGGRLRQGQVDGFESIFDAWERIGTHDRRHLAYILATAWHETGARMEPVRETFAITDRQAVQALAGRSYARRQDNGQAYYGRGYVQLTWADNYKRAGDILDLPLYDVPDLVMQPETAAVILVRGMIEGWFTGKRLEQYINDQRCDYEGARKIINGTDRKQMIAGYAEKFAAVIVERCA